RADEHAAGATDQEIRRLQAEAIALQLFPVVDLDAHRAVGIARRAGTMGATETALTGAQAQCSNALARVKYVADIAAMAGALDAIPRHPPRIAQNETGRCQQRA